MPLSLRLARPAAGQSRTASTPSTGQSVAPRAARSAAPIWLAIAVGAWVSVAALAVTLYAVSPPQAGFDLELLLAAGRRVAAGTSPYDHALLAGSVPTAVDLFYSYPPPVAQYLALFARVPSPLMLVAWAVAAVGGLAAVAVALARHLRRPAGMSWPTAVLAAALPVVAVAPIVLPFTIATLFGNLDAFFPLLYGLMLLAALVPSTAARFEGGAALAIASFAKLHPASMALWFLVRGLRERRRPAPALARPPAPASDGAGSRPLPGGWVVLLAAAAVGLVILVLSLAVGGAQPWSDYLSVVRAASSAAVVGISNVGPAAQIALMTGGGEDLARVLGIAVLVGAVVVTALAAWMREDTIESFAWATTASLVVLPVTWIHYPVALLPVAVAAWLRADQAVRRDVALLLGAAMFVAFIAVAVPVLVWVSIALVLGAVRRSAPATVAELPLPTLEPSRIVRSRTPV